MAFLLVADSPDDPELFVLAVDCGDDGRELLPAANANDLGLGVQLFGDGHDFVELVQDR